MRKLLDAMFKNKKLAFWCPLIFAVLMYLLFLVFGEAEDKNSLLITTPISAIFALFGVFFVLFVQVKNPSCPEWFLNTFELITTVLFTLYAVFGAVSFLVGGFRNFNPIICCAAVSYSAISWAHNKRTR